MTNQTRILCKANLDKRIFIDDVPNTLTYREYIREMEEDLDMSPGPLDDYETDELIEYVEELQSTLDYINVVCKGE